MCYYVFLIFILEMCVLPIGHKPHRWARLLLLVAPRATTTTTTIATTTTTTNDYDYDYDYNYY